MDSSIIRIPRVAEASVPLAVNRKAHGRQQDHQREQAERQPRPDVGNTAKEMRAAGGTPAAHPSSRVPSEAENRAVDFAGLTQATRVTAPVEAPARNVPEDQRTVLEEAKTKAYREGFTAGTEDAQRALAAQGEAMAALIESLAQSREELLNEVEDDVIAIVFRAVTTIIGNTVAEQAGVVEVVRRVIAQVRDRDGLVVRVSSRDFEVAREASGYGKRLGARVEVVAEPRILPGGCLVESSAGTLDGRLEVQLQSLRELLLGLRSGAGNG
jgi:flagellar assembly protein FliH